MQRTAAIEARSSSATSSLALTGERTAPGIASENYWFRRHQAAYLHLREEVLGPRVLEVGAGEGYGSALLAERVPTVLALDYDALAIAHLARRYPSLAAVRGNLAVLPVADGSIDTVVCLQVIEHVWDHPQFVSECARVLRPGGLLMLSTPNRLTFSPGLDKPLNPFHTHEFTAAELRRLVAGSGLSVLAVHGLFGGPAVDALDSRYAAHGGFVAAQLAAPPERWTAELAAEVASIRWQDFQVSPGCAAGPEAAPEAAPEAGPVAGPVAEPVAEPADVDQSLDLVLLARRP
jgi:SAM-dependent methyltransferase